MKTGVKMAKKENYQCDFCEKAFPGIAQLQKHHGKNHGDLVGAYQCKECEKTFDLSIILEKHLKIAHPQQNGKFLKI